MATAKRLVEPVTLHLPDLPESVDGLTIAHLTDLHIRRPRRRFRQVIEEVAALETDVVVLTGDYISLPGDEEHSLPIMRSLCDSLRSRLGVFGIFGNHDTAKIRRMFRDLPVHWLENTSARLGDLPIQIIGYESDESTWPDTVSTVVSLTNNNGRHNKSNETHHHHDRVQKTVRILLSHYPSYLPTAADMGVDLMLAGHTHGGQLRLPGRRALFNSSDLPLPLTSGILRHRDTLCVISRGLGENWVPLRVLCPPHLPVYTLRRGPLLGEPTHHIHNVVPW